MLQRIRGNRKPNVPVSTNERQSIINGSMPASEILIHLGRHGCKDVTDELKLSNVGRSVVFSGGFGDVYRGTLQTGDRVAIKYLRMLVTTDDSGEKQLKRTARELYVWSKCIHPNILPLIGVAKYDNRIAMVSPWMENGNLNWYLTRHPMVDRYNLCSQIADAVAYLKESDIIHGDIKGANILVSGDHVPKLTDFGTSVLRQYTLGFTTTSTGPHTTLRWTAPEIFLEETKHTFEGDVYALGMTILEIFTGSAPYEGLLDVAVMRRLMQREHPERPQSIPIGNRSSDLLWEIMTSCWDNEPLKRPTARQVRDKFNAIIRFRTLPRSSISIDTSPHELLHCLVAHGSHNLTHEIGHTEVSYNPRPDLGGQQQYYDPWITGQTRNNVRVFMGRASHLYPFSFGDANDEATATLLTAHEGYILSQCNHPNIRGIMGVALHDDALSLVFRELEPGHQRFHEVVWTEREQQAVPNFKMATQICEAVAYLHGIDIVHGAINPWNILVSPDFNIQLSGFHNAYIRTPSLVFPDRERVTVVYANLADHYTAPESCMNDSQPRLSWTIETDMFALGTTILDMLSSKSGMVNWKPGFDYYIPQNEHGDRLCDLIVDCRAFKPEDRPLATNVRDIMATITEEGLGQPNIRVSTRAKRGGRLRLVRQESAENTHPPEHERVDERTRTRNERVRANSHAQ